MNNQETNKDFEDDAFRANIKLQLIEAGMLEVHADNLIELTIEEGADLNDLVSFVRSLNERSFVITPTPFCISDEVLVAKIGGERRRKSKRGKRFINHYS